MLSKALIAVCLFQAAVTIGSSLKPVCPSGWIPLSITQSCYYFSKIKTDWSSARSSCRKLGGNLVVFENIHENNAIWKIAQRRGFSAPWIGLLRHRDNKFYTVYGSKPSYTNWSPGEPNGNHEKCGHLYTSNGKWNDIPCSRNYHFICEQPKSESTFPYGAIGCFKDNGNRAVPTLEGQDPNLNGGYQQRTRAVEKCYKAAKRRGFQVFAVQNGGWCASGPTAAKTFNKYGKSTACQPDGEGGPWANQVYYIKDYNAVGCYKDTSNRAIQTLEGKDPVLDGSYGSRQNPIEKCALAATRAGYDMFAVQNGGWCASSATAPKTYDKYGKSKACQTDGEGGPWANQVYLIEITPVRKLYCGENSMKLVVSKSYFNVSSGTQLQLLDSSCRPRETKWHYIFTTSLTGCGTTITTDSQGKGTVTFANKIIERRSAFGSSITRSKETEFPFSCHYPRSYLVSSLPSFGLVDTVTTLENVTGQGNITLVMDLYKDKSFRQSLDTKPSLNKRMYVEIRILNTTNSSSTHSSSGIKLNECYATSIGSQPVYRHTLIERGCPKDKTVKFHQSGITARFSFQTFRFRGLHHYTTRIHCRVTVCETNSKSCQVKCSSNGKRKRMFFEQDDENITYLY